MRLTADSMLYVSIADKYLAGDFHNAVNGYWGPLLAWLLIPFLHFGATDLFAINSINLIVGVLTIIGIWLLSYRFEMSDKVRGVIMVSSVPIVMLFSLVQPMDFLLVCILGYYLAIIFSNNYCNKISYGVSAGILGALAYFSKAYAFPFFIMHFFFMNVFHYFRDLSGPNRKTVFLNAVTGFLVFFLLSGIWIAAISNKYGHMTFSTMRDTDFNAPGPEVKGGGLEFGVPIFYEGFIEPPNETAFVVWEDPSYLRGKPWSPWQSVTHFVHFIRLSLKNIAEGLQIVQSFSALSIAIIIAYILLLSTQTRRSLLQQGNLLYPLFTIVLYSGGFVLFHFEPRYIWIVNILVLLMGGQVIHILLQNNFFNSNMRKNIIIACFFASFIFTPGRLVIQDRNSMDKDMYDLSLDLRTYNIHGNIASNRECLPVHDAWHKTFRIAYWLNSRYYGQARQDINDAGLEEDLKKFMIDYYFYWGQNEYIPGFLSHHKEITNGAIPGLRIFSLRENTR